jgi:PhnB protein
LPRGDDVQAGWMTTDLVPMLTVRDAAAASEFYQRAFGATEISRVAAPNGTFVIELDIDGQRFYAVDENPQAFNASPQTLGGTSVRLSLIVDDPDEAAAHAVASGASIVFPVTDQPYGMRQGRVADPFGHHWLIGRNL